MSTFKKILKWVGLTIGVLVVFGAILYLNSIDFSNPEGFEEYLEAKFNKSNIVGTAITITKGDEVVFFKGLGYSDKKNKTPITEDTLFQIASISKLVTGTAVMQLYEQGRIDIDADINSYLPFKVENPHHPDTIITPRMILTHTSSIQDDWKVYDSFYTIKSGGGDSPVTLAEFLPAYLVEDGQYYDSEKVYYNTKPGTEYNYSNVGYALLGYMVEYMTGQDFSAYCHENIFKPLGMNSTGWRFSEVDQEDLTIHYQRPLWLYLKPLPPYGFVTYPDGCLKTSSADWSRFMMAMKNGGALDGNQVLKEETVAMMWTPQIPEIYDSQGITWELNTIETFWIERNTPTPGHTGGDPGIVTLSFIIPENDSTVTIFLNSDLPWAPRMENIMRMLERVIAEAESL
jgi:CubicO group peptidase (beta-lactamase class C family)